MLAMHIVHGDAHAGWVQAPQPLRLSAWPVACCAPPLLVPWPLACCQWTQGLQCWSSQTHTGCVTVGNLIQTLSAGKAMRKVH